MLTILAIALFFAALVSAEIVVSTIIEVLVAIGLTQILKKYLGVGSLGATALAFLMAAIIGIGSFAISTALSGGELTVEIIAQEAAKIFTLATLAYRALAVAMKSPSDDDDTPDLDDGDAL